MFVNRRWRRRRQALLGRGMADDGRASRPSVRDPAPDPLACDRLYGTRSGTRSSRTHATDLTARDPAPAPFARDPAPAPCARDRLYGTRSGTGSFRTRLTLRHAIRHPAPLARDRFYGTRSDTGSFRTRPTLRHTIRHRLLSHATIMICSEYVRNMPGYARICPMMSRCRDRPATALRDASGPTIRVRCAAGEHGDRYG